MATHAVQTERVSCESVNWFHALINVAKWAPVAARKTVLPPQLIAKKLLLLDLSLSVDGWVSEGNPLIPFDVVAHFHDHPKGIGKQMQKRARVSQ